jgi:hypothetical protein
MLIVIRVLFFLNFLTYHILDWEQSVDIEDVPPPVVWAGSLVADHNGVVEHGVVIKPPCIELCYCQYEEIGRGQPET